MLNHSSPRYYQKLTELPIYSPPQASEGLNKYHFITERHLHALWWEQTYFSNLKTETGDTIEVLSPGLWNAGEGPDFKKAHLNINGFLVKGDIEIHLTDSGWTSHRHNENPNYNDTILHISLYSTHKQAIVTSAGKNVSKLYLEPFINIPMEKILHCIDIDLYPYKPYLGSGNCSKLIFQTLKPDDLQVFFSSAALWRLKQKFDQIAQLGTSPTISIKAALARALGFPHNSGAFLTLFQWLSSLHITDSNQLLAYAIGACGFFSIHYETLWGHSEVYSTLKKEYYDNPPAFLPVVRMFTHQVRPMHHPLRRLVYLVQLILDETFEIKLQELVELANLHTNTEVKKERLKLFNLLLEWIPNYKDNYWNHYYLFEIQSKPQYLTLLGNNAKKEMVLNVLFPVLYNYFDNKKCAEKVWNLYQHILGNEHSKGQHLQYRFFGDHKVDDFFRKAYTVQGALQIHYDFCRHFESSCKGCPFVERFKKYVT